MLRERFNKLKEEINNRRIDGVIEDYIKSSDRFRRFVGKAMLVLLYYMATERLGEEDLMAFYEEYIYRLEEIL